MSDRGFFPGDAPSQGDQELIELERRLNDEVDEDFFEEPKTFNTLHRVIDVLGLQMIDDATVQSAHQDLVRNPAYRTLKGQQHIVEGAIEHMAVIHCADLNGSVIQVGKVSRQFNEAVSKVRQLRKQVRDIQDTLGASTQANPNEGPPGGNGSAKATAAGSTSTSRPQNAAAMSLRELWLKKLECEATLALLEKLDVIRAAPATFDQFIQPPCRIGAAVLTLSQALQTMFSDDVAQVQALHKIMEQLMLRKQRAEEILWDTLSDVLYLRTGNGLGVLPVSTGAAGGGNSSSNESVKISSAHSVSSDSKRTSRFRSTAPAVSIVGLSNPFASPQIRFAVDEDMDDQTVDSTGSGASLFSLEDDEIDTGSGNSMGRRMMIPLPMLEAELDLEQDERRCLEEIALSGISITQSSKPRQRQLPRYAEPVLALRILVECLTQLKRLDDVERILNEGLEREIRQIVQREQARTFARLEKKRAPQGIRSLGKTESLKDFRRHLTGLLSAFGNVMLRLSHLAEILRFRIGSEKELAQAISSPTSVMRSVLNSAFDIMQREIKDFLKACLYQSETSKSDAMDHGMRKGSTAYETGLFSLGVVESSTPNPNAVSKATRTNVMEMTVGKFVSTILFPKTKVGPEVRHALTFRRIISRWTVEVESLMKELATTTGEDVSAPSFRAAHEEPAIAFMDTVIQNDLLPVLQKESVDGTVQGLERRDAFDPALDRTLYARPNSNEPQDVDMCKACLITYEFTGPLFMALHRLPRDGDMYLPLVAVLEHVMLTFISRVKLQVENITSRKTALTLLVEENKQTSFANVVERRKPFSTLLRAYADGDLLDSSPSTSKAPGMMRLAPSDSDTASRRSSGLKADPSSEEIAEGVEGEEQILQQELEFLKPYLEFGDTSQSNRVSVCSDEELMKAACLAHSLLKLASMLESRLKLRGRTLTSTRALREAIKTVKANGIKMAKFCRLDMLMQTVSRLAKVCTSSTLVARDAVRIPSSVNDLGEYLTSASDNLRESAGNAVTAYTFSSLEQYIPLCLMQTVRVIAAGKGIITRSPMTMNGIEALDRSGSVLYRDLKGATGFDNSSWDVELAAVSFERSASFMAMMELEMEELVAYYQANPNEFPSQDFEVMFSMTGPRRRGDVGKYHLAKRSLK